ncbi:MAG TPA: hypothetical protein VFS00_01295 [Polyangiaceae bacterium]|nr:hypothetical protein [Polyangiaceae bacterium]
MALIYLIKNAGSSEVTLDLDDKKAYVFGGPFKLKRRDPSRADLATSFLAVNDAETTFLTDLAQNSTDDLTVDRPTSLKDPWPSPPALSKVPSANANNFSTKSGAESALAGLSGSSITYERLSLSDQESPVTGTPTLDLTNRGAFAFRGLIGLAAGNSLLLVSSDADGSSVSSRATNVGLTVTELFDGSTPQKPDFPDPSGFDLSQTPFGQSVILDNPPLPPRLRSGSPPRDDAPDSFAPMGK